MISEQPLEARFSHVAAPIPRTYSAIATCRLARSIETYLLKHQ